jgi:methionyl-tRNA synthetase
MLQDVSLTILTPWALPVHALALLPLLAWSFAWKGVALWRAASRRDYYWFTALLLINSVGVLDIVYLYFFSQRPPPASPSQP